MPQPAPSRVLLVDDDPDYTDLLRRFMAKAFPDAEVATHDPVKSGRPVEGFDWSRFDVLIMEYRLGPHDNGLEWLRRYKQNTESFPATILLTASGNEDVAVRALRYGAHDYLRKQDLSSKRLAESIADAFNMRDRQSSATQSLTLNASRFSKSFFYGQFSLAFDEAEKGENRALVLISIDGYESLRGSLGVLGTDAIARYLGKLGTEIFTIQRFKPRATRFTDSSIAMLVGQYKDRNDLERLLKALCARVKASPPEFDGSPVRITVSIGAVIIVSRAPAVSGLLDQAEQAAARAAEQDGNSLLLTEATLPENKGLDTGERARLFDAREALRENRLQPVFQALMKVSEKPSKYRITELFQVNPRFVAHNGDTLPVDSVLDSQKDKSLPRIIDRWKIRECVNRLVSEEFSGAHTTGFYVAMSEASCTDVKLAGWISGLIKHHGRRRRFEEICLAFSAKDFMQHLKGLLALIKHLRQEHNFLFAVENVSELELAKVCLTQFPFDFLVLSFPDPKGVSEKVKALEQLKDLIEFGNNRGALTVARDIENAGNLTDAISAGVDFVQGHFIAPEQEEIESAVGIESVQLGS